MEDNPISEATFDRAPLVVSSSRFWVEKSTLLRARVLGTVVSSFGYLNVGNAVPDCGCAPELGCKVKYNIWLRKGGYQHAGRQRSTATDSVLRFRPIPCASTGILLVVSVSLPHEGVRAILKKHDSVLAGLAFRVWVSQKWYLSRVQGSC